MSMPSLLTGLKAWWAFEEEFDAGHTAHDSSGNGNHLETEGNPLDAENGLSYGERYATRVPGKVGHGIAPTRVYKLNANAADFKLNAVNNDTWTWAFWLKIPGTVYNDDPAIFGKQKPSADLEYRLWSAGGELAFAPDLGSASVSVQPDEWCFVVLWADTAAEMYKIEVRVPSLRTLQADSTPIVAFPALNDSPFWIGNELASQHPGAYYDEMALWHRVLTAEERQWLYNEGGGRTYSDIQEPAASADCQTEQCCPPKLDEYDATGCAQASSQTPCEEPPSVEFMPPSGNPVVFPVMVRLYSDNALAVIRYTLDGTEPTAESEVYSGPLRINGPHDIIKASAFYGACPVMAFSGQWIAAPVGVQFCYKGITDDKCGGWDVFVPSGSNDHAWYFETAHAAVLGVDHFEVFQLNALGAWTTGQVWSTQKQIVPPPPDWDQGQIFESYPLVIFDAAPPLQLNNDYTTDWGPITPPGVAWNMYGQPVQPIADGEYFLLIIHMDDGSKMYATALAGMEADCGGEPPPCPTLPAPVLTPGCGSIKVDALVPGPDRPWEIYSSACNNPEPLNFVLLASGNGSGVITRTHSGLHPACNYYYYYRVDVSGDYPQCPQWVYSPVAVARPICSADGTLDASHGDGCAGSSVLLSYTTICSDPADNPEINLTQGDSGDIDSPALPIVLQPNVAGTVEIQFGSGASGVYAFTLDIPGQPDPAASGYCADGEVTVEVEIGQSPDFGTVFQGPAILQLAQYREFNADNALMQLAPPVFADAPIPAELDPNCTKQPCFGLNAAVITDYWDMRLFLHSSGLYWWPASMPRVRFTTDHRAALAGESPGFHIHSGGTLQTGFGVWSLIIIRALECLPGFENCLGSLALWRGHRCGSDPRGEYVSDFYAAHPDAQILTKPSNSHIYSINVTG